MFYSETLSYMDVITKFFFSLHLDYTIDFSAMLDFNSVSLPRILKFDVLQRNIVWNE